ncbi:MAG: heat shock protein DnaJ domain protein [Verrucomicrobiaceae bacterium]|nr:heat shock protein DnaJ domain protein [Verrucomicrobiaceae bacterium]
MNSPWTVLGLDPQSATEKDVKVAYARLIKQHRPDSDPEGFQRVRQAYEAALAMLKDGNMSRSDDGDETQPLFEQGGESGPLPSASLPPELIEVELAIGRAREANDEEALAKAIETLQPVCEKLRPGRAGVLLWQKTLHRVTEGTAALVAAAVPIDQLIHEMENGSAIVTHTVIAHWESREDMDKLVELAEAVIANAALASHSTKLQNQEAAIVALRLGVETGFVKPVLSTVLVRFAFPHVDREARESLISKVEEQAGIGNLMPGLRKDQQAFWHKRIRHGRQEWDWNSQESNDALDYLARQMHPGWSGFGIIQQVVPQDWFSRLEKETGRRQGGPLGRFRRASLSRLRPVSQPSGGGGSWRGYGWLIFIVISTLARLASNNHPSPSSPLYHQSTYPTKHRNDPFADIASFAPPAVPVPDLKSYTSPSRSALSTQNQFAIAEGSYNRTYSSTESNNLIASDKRIATSGRSALSLPPQLTRADETYKRAQAEFGGTSASIAPSLSALPTRSTSSPSYRAKTAKERADKLRTEGKSLQFWFDSANEIEKQALEAAKGLPPEKRSELGRKCRQDLYKLMTQVHTNSMDPAYEPRFLDVLLLDPNTSPDQRAMALARMADTQTPYIFLPKWEEAADVTPVAAGLVGRTARVYLDHKGGGLLEEERQRLERLAKNSN